MEEINNLQGKFKNNINILMDLNKLQEDNQNMLGDLIKKVVDSSDNVAS